MADEHVDPTDSGTVTTFGRMEVGGVVLCTVDPSAPPLRAPSESPDWATQVPGSTDLPTGWGSVVADLDGDDIPDIFLPQRDADQLFLGVGDGNFALATDALPASDGVPANGASAVDYDGDGDLDLLLLQHGPDALWANDGAGHFTDVTAVAGLAASEADGISGAWGDMDADGDLDLFVANNWTDELHPVPQEAGSWDGDPNLLWENVDGVFVDRSDRLTTRNALSGFTFVGGWWDLGDTAGSDLYVVNDKWHEGFQSAFLANQGDGTFVDAPEHGLDLPMNAMGLGVGDLNDDQVPDFAVSDWGLLWLLVSDGAGGWYDAATARGLRLPADERRQVGWGVELADVDNDGDDDLVVAYGPDDLHRPTTSPEGVVGELDQPDGLWRQGDDGTFTQAAEALGFDDVGIGRGVVPADLDGDGSLDFVRRDLAGVARIDLQPCTANGWLEVALAGPPPNTRGVGARVTVEAGERRWTRWIEAGSTNIASSGPLEAHFGLGAVDRVDRITVRWPDGVEQSFSDVASRQRVRIVRPDAP